MSSMERYLSVPVKNSVADLKAHMFCVMLVSYPIISCSYSTDFEVHRNWLAITYSLPWFDWYLTEILSGAPYSGSVTEILVSTKKVTHGPGSSYYLEDRQTRNRTGWDIYDKSEWTLDYPPLFAWFEKLLSMFAGFFDYKMVILDNLNYASPGTIIFQRLSVIVTDFVYFYAVFKAMRYVIKQGYIRESTGLSMVYSSLFIFNFGLFLVDHIHFQYNGVLFGIWIISITELLQERWIRGAFYFSVLLNMKHIFLYVAPAYFIYILRYGCFVKTKGELKFKLPCFLQVGFTVILVFGISFGPFILKGSIWNVIARLFPFKRGLCHAYWAPNFWAIYNFVDKILFYICRFCGSIHIGKPETASMTGGMVKEYDHSVLPSIRPMCSILITFLFILPIMWRLISNTSTSLKSKDFLKAVTLCGWTSYMFGWHVHEKAIIMILVPSMLLLPMSSTYRSLFVLISTTGHYSLLPLVFQPAETSFKVSFLILSTISSTITESQFTYESYRNYSDSSILFFLRKMYLLGFIPLFIFTDCLSLYMDLFNTFPFLPLLLTSVYCSLGVVYSYIICYANFILKSE